jgi:diketogulonate reductase-like aldo/keto reductase
MEYFELLSGHTMPALGLGTWKLRNQQCKTVVKQAVEMGYTHIDTAWMYANQREIGEALQEIGAKRHELFITSKIWHTHMERDNVLSQCDECLDQLRVDYVDLLLIHSPSQIALLEETLGAFKEIVDAGKAKSIGISNFNNDQVDQARKISAVPISANQVEYNVHHNREELLQHCAKYGIHVTAHRPLATGEIGDERLLNEIAKRHGKTAAQVAMRWLLQKGISVIPKSGSKGHLEENLDLFDWELTATEMKQIDNLGDQLSG